MRSLHGGAGCANQTEVETARASEVEIFRATQLPREADKAARKRYRDRQDELVASEDEAEDGAAFGGSGRLRPTPRPVLDASRGTRLDQVAR
jgi:hypothetical protein